MNNFILDALRQWQGSCLPPPALQVSGKLVKAVGLLLEAQGCRAPVGTLCQVEAADGESVMAEIVGFRHKNILLTALDGDHGFAVGGLVTPTGASLALPLGQGTIGRVLNALGVPIDGKGPLRGVQQQTLAFEKINPLARLPIRDVLDVGIRAINSVLTVGRGQRIGLFAGSGVGKSVLLGMMARNTNADVIVVGLIGERGREVKEFIDEILGEEGLKKAVVVVSPADDPAMMRLYGAQTSTRIAEYFRDQGKSVLLLMDSLTRYAQAQREISLAAGEPPATKGYTPSVFAKLPALVERAGTSATHNGAITAFYTVLVEGDDQQGPIADAARAILDGHIVLNRRIAEEGIYPAIDIEASVSRVMPAITDEKHREAAATLRRWMSAFQRNADLIRIGAYKKGTDPDLDKAVEKQTQIRTFLSQKMTESSSFEQTKKSLFKLVSE